MNSWNLDLYAAINAPVNAAPWLLALARAAAEWPVYIAALLLVVLWIRGRPATRGVLIAATAAVGCALAANLLIGTLRYQPRPFVLGIGHTFVTHAPDASFPSDHATLIWGIALSLMAGGLRWAGESLAALGVATAWARIYLGIHFPLDMAGALFMALAAALLARALRGPIEAYVLPRIEELYDAILEALRVPHSLCPRRVPAAGDPRSKTSTAHDV